MWLKLHQRLAFRLFISYVAVILINIVVLAVAVEIAIPSAFSRHMTGMQGMVGMMGMMDDMGADMFTGFRAGVNEALAIATVAALMAALAASLMISHRVVAPVLAMTQASLRIADGQLSQRVAVPQADREQLDELAQLAQAFNQMAGRLEHAEQMRQQLLADVSHELRTPLTAIKGSMEALVDGVLPAEPATFTQIEREADRLQRLVNDLQELSRVEAGAVPLHRQPVALEALVRDAVKRLEPQFIQKDIHLKLNLPAVLPSVYGDADRLLQVLINLLNNAWQYTLPGGEVRIQARLQENEVCVSIADNGIGIPPEHLPLLFTRFYRVDKSRSRQAGGGSGIGLTIARHLVEAHGGRVWAESAGAGQGSTFSFALPVTPL